MNIINKCLSAKEFKDYIAKKSFSPNNPNKLCLHHTWKPDVADWNGAKTISGLKRYYEGLGWSAGPHLFIAEDGIWLFTDMNKQGIHAGLGNKNSIGIEVVGNYDPKVWKGKTKENALSVIELLSAKLGLTFGDIHYHRMYSAKTCPGKMITSKWLKEKLEERKIRPVEVIETPEPVQTPPKVETATVAPPDAPQAMPEPIKLSELPLIDQIPHEEKIVVDNYTWIDELKELIRDLIKLFKRK